MSKMKKSMLAATLVCGTTMGLTACGDKEDNPVEPVKDVTDYSKKSSWYKLPEITKEFDTF